MPPAVRSLARLAIRSSLVTCAWTAAADDATMRALDRASQAQAVALDVLQKHHQFEEELVRHQSDRLTVFFSTRQAENLALAEVALAIDGKPVVSHRYSADERRGLQGRAVQLVHAGRIEPGVHEVHLVVTLDNGTTIPMTPRKFSKGRGDKFIEIQLTGGAARSFGLLEW